MLAINCLSYLMGSLSSTGVIRQSLLIALATLGTGTLIFAVLHYSRKFVMYIGYGALVFTFISTVEISFLMPRVVPNTILSFIVVLAVSLIYMKPWLLIVSFVASTIMIIVSLVPVITSPDEMVSPMVIYILISFLMYGLAINSNRLLKEVDKSRKENQVLYEEQEQRNQKLIAMISNSSDHLDNIANTGETNIMSFEEMSSSFQQLASGAANQAKSASHISELTMNLDDLMNELTNSTSVLVNSVEDASHLSDEGRSKIGMLSNSSQGLHHYLQNVSALANELIERIQDTTGLAIPSSRLRTRRTCYRSTPASRQRGLANMGRGLPLWLRKFANWLNCRPNRLTRYPDNSINFVRYP